MLAHMKTITRRKLADILASVDHAIPLGFIALTDADAKKTDNPYGRILKLTRINAFAGADYTRSVNRALVKEGKEPTFVAKGRANQTERISPCLARKVVDGEDRFYLPVQIRHARKPLYLVQRARGLGRTMLTAVSKEQVEPFLPVSRQPAQGGVESPVVYRDFRLDSITQISLNGEQYRIR